MEIYAGLCKKGAVERLTYVTLRATLAYDTVNQAQRFETALGA